MDEYKINLNNHRYDYECCCEQCINFEKQLKFSIKNNKELLWILTLSQQN